MNCPKCGAAVRDGSAFCMNCGQPLRAANPQQPQYAQPQQQYNYSPQQQYHYAQPQQVQQQAQPQYNYAQPRQPQQQYNYAQPKQVQQAQPQQYRYAPPAQQPYAQPQQPYAQLQQQYAPPQQAQYAQRPVYPQQPAYQNAAPAANVGGFEGFWFKFMAYVGLYLTAAALLLMGIGSMVGWQYGAVSYFGYSFRYVEGIASQYVWLRVIDFIIGALYIALAVLAVLTGVSFTKYKRNVPSLVKLIYGGFAGLLLAYTVTVIVAFAVDGANFQMITTAYPIVFPIIMLVLSIALFVVNSIYFKSQKFRFVN